MDQLTIMQWNMNGFHARYSELRMYLSSHDIDVICLQETRLCTSALSTMPGYTIIRKDRPKGTAGGIAILIKTGLNYQELISSRKLECQQIQLKISNTTIDIINVYIPPSEKLAETDIEDAFVDGNSIILGDFNAKSPRWGSNKTCSRGRLIEKFIDRHNIVI